MLPRVFCDRDRVVIVPPGRRQDLILSPDEAERFAEDLYHAAAQCERWVAAGGKRHIFVGRTRGAHVESWDGNVNVRFDSVVSEEYVPFEGARALATEILAKVPEARERMRIVWRPNLIGS